MEIKKQKPGQAAVKSGPSKRARKKRRIFPWLFLILFVLVGVIGAGFFFRLIPLDPETAANLEPYIVKMESYVDKMKSGNKAEEETVGGKPKTNFPLVELDENKKAPVSQPTASTSGLLGAPAVASAASAQSAPGAAGAGKTSSSVKESVENAKVYGKLSKLYSAMKPEEAVAVFNNLEDEQVVMILSRMEDEAAARVLASLEAKRAARLTQAMIKRK